MRCPGLVGVLAVFLSCASAGAYETCTWHAPLTTNAPTIDGVINAAEWQDGTAFSLYYPDSFLHCAVHRPGLVLPIDPCDWSLRGWVKWDSNSLYCALEITDDINASDPLDYPQIAFNVNNDPNALYLIEAIIWDLRQDGSIQTNTTDSSAYKPVLTQLAVTSGGDKRYYELALSWDDLGGHAPALGQKHGWGWSCQDHDIGGAREHHWLSWGNGLVAFLDYGKWNLVELTAGQSCGDWGYELTDSNSDCATDLLDFAQLAADWSKCTDPGMAGCAPP